jgi:putative transposase
LGGPNSLVFAHRALPRTLSDALATVNVPFASACLMDNHYHLLVETEQPTLSRGMREVNGTYS